MFYFLQDSFAEHARLQRRITQKQRQLEDHGTHWRYLIVSIIIVPVKINVSLFLLLTEKKSSSAHLRQVVLLQGVCFVLIVSSSIWCVARKNSSQRVHFALVKVSNLGVQLGEELVCKN